VSPVVANGRRHTLPANSLLHTGKPLLRLLALPDMHNAAVPQLHRAAPHRRCTAWPHTARRPLRTADAAAPHYAQRLRPQSPEAMTRSKTCGLGGGPARHGDHAGRLYCGSDSCLWGASCRLPRTKYYTSPACARGMLVMRRFAVGGRDRSHGKWASDGCGRGDSGVRRVWWARDFSGSLEERWGEGVICGR
jgi:hypothetical protein